MKTVGKLIADALLAVDEVEASSGDQLRELALVTMHLEDAQLRLLRFSMVTAQQEQKKRGGDS